MYHNGTGFIISSTPRNIKDIPLTLVIRQRTSGYEFHLTNHYTGKDNILHFYFTESFLVKFTAHPFFTLCHIDYPGYLCDLELSGIVATLLKCHYPEHSAPLYYEAKATELLTLALDRISVSIGSLSLLKLSSSDIEMLENARGILISDFDNIPTIKQLARKVGTNDFKLKKGFKQHFGSSIFAYVQNVRMEKARKLLMETDHTITDVAYMTGYEHSNNFSEAFKKKFGVVPGIFRRK